MKLKHYILVLTLIVSTHIYSSEDNPFISGKALHEDLSLFEQTVKTVHPGLFRYITQEEFEMQLANVKTQFKKGLNSRDAYLVFTGLAAKIQCSHTHTNPYNQNSFIKSLTTEASDKLPITMKRIGDQFFVEFNGSEQQQIVRGDEIVAINDVAIDEIYESFSDYIAVDGKNQAKTDDRLSYFLGDRYQWIDILLPMLYPPLDNRYQVKIKRNNKTESVLLEALSAQQRDQVISERTGIEPQRYDSSWEYQILGNDVAYLKIGTFATYKMKMDWKAFIDNAFAYFQESDATQLILDIRNNEGGMYEVATYLYDYFLTTKIIDRPFEQRVVYQIVPQHLRPYLKTWNNDIFEVSQFTQPVENKDYYLFASGNSEKAFSGEKNTGIKETVVLVDKANSSATFIMAKLLNQFAAATLIGESMGGNLYGQNGGQMFFLKLPHSQISIDIPLIGFFDTQHEGSHLLKPDILVEIDYDSWMSGEDIVLQEAISHLKQ